MRLAALALITVIGLVAAVPAHADTAAAARGKAVVDQWCRECHLKANDKPNKVMAPRYEDIVRRPGRNEAYFRKFLATDHFPMTIYRLFEDEKRDVVAYLMSLKAKR
jgi:cytochrome c2